MWRIKQTRKKEMEMDNLPGILSYSTLVVLLALACWLGVSEGTTVCAENRHSLWLELLLTTGTCKP
jgi:hypothetical protein